MGPRVASGEPRMSSPRQPVVVHVITRMILGGPTRPVLAALSRMSERGLNPVLVTGSPTAHELADRAAYLTAPGLTVMELRSLVRAPSVWKDFSATIALSGAIRRLRPALIHTHTAKAGALGRIAGWLQGRDRPRAVHTFHGHSLNRASAGRSAAVWRLIERRLARSATDLIVTLSPQQRDEITSLLGDRVGSRVVVLPLAFDPAMCPADHDQTRAFSEAIRRPGDRVLAFVGRGVPVKGLSDLARAHARLKATDERAARALRVALVGPLEPAVESSVRSLLAVAGLADRWNFWGPAFNPRPALDAVDGVVLPSHSEGTPVSILEALSLGLPVLASAVGGVPELLSGNWSRRGAGEWRVETTTSRGLLVPAGDIDAWAAALRAFAVDPGQIPGDADERRAFVAKTFDPEQHVADLLALYARLGVTARGGPST